MAVTMTFPDTPVWAPLTRAVPEAWRVDFMFMGRAEAEGCPPLYLYKHVDTRHYLNLDARGGTYAFWHGDLCGDTVDSGYVPVASGVALAPFWAWYARQKEGG